jgi:hypothetical protein
MNFSEQDIDFLLSPEAIRQRAGVLFDLTCEGKTNFDFHEDKFDEVVDFVIETINKNYPDLNIPFHSRWGHFKAAGVDRVSDFEKRIAHLDPLEQVRAKLDLVITSVLLDAGAGPKWKYTENGKEIARSEGLGVASYYMFCAGAFSNDKENPYRADANKLELLSELELEKHFQVSDKNPLVGVSGRVELLQNLGSALKLNKEIFFEGRPGNILDYLLDNKTDNQIEAEDILRAVLDGLGPIWPGRISLGETNMGDVWRHELVGSGIDGLIPFHKLSQWLTYSLIEPIAESGVEVVGVENLTGLAEYRNGGLLLDKQLITLKDEINYKKKHKPDSEVIIEWRALTIHLLDKIGSAVQKKLQKTPQEFPLAKVLEGGTWWAGRFAAMALREDGSPPLKLDSDGTVF